MVASLQEEISNMQDVLNDIKQRQASRRNAASVDPNRTPRAQTIQQNQTTFQATVRDNVQTEQVPPQGRRLDFESARRAKSHLVPVDTVPSPDYV